MPDHPTTSQSSTSGTDCLSLILAWVSFYLRPIIKGFLRLTTRLCELQRVCYGESAGGPRSIAVEQSLMQSRVKEVQDLVRELDSRLEKGDLDDQIKERAAFDASVNVVLSVKKIKKDLHQQFIKSLRHCLYHIWGYRQLIAQVESLRSTGFDDENLEHEQSLLELWKLLQPGVPLSKRKTKEWQSIGFQGEDPKTDFRGMGILGLQNLLHFSREYNSVAKHILSHSHHPKHGYSFAIVGINLTHMAYRLLVDGSAKSHIFNLTEKTGSAKPNLNHFHHLYTYLLVEFDKFWMESKPRDVMEFNRLRDLFENRIRDDLKNPACCFKVNLQVEAV